MTDTETTAGALAAFVSGLRYEQLPDRVREQATILIADAVACALAGHHGSQYAMVAATASELGGTGSATVIGGDRLSIAGAVLLNGYAITAVNACDMYRPSAVHVTPIVLPAALAVAEETGASGAELVRAVAAGAEVLTRVGRAFDRVAFRQRGWQSAGVVGPFGAAAAAGALLDLDVAHMLAAFGLAGSQAAGTVADWGTPANKFQQFRAGLSGVAAGLLAAKGYSSGSGIMDADPGGLYGTYAHGSPDLVVDGLGEEWELTRISLRRWPASGDIQGVITAVNDALGEQALQEAGIDDVMVLVSGDVFELHGQIPHPSDAFQRFRSIHYVTAARLLDGRLGLEQFNDRRAADPAMERLLPRITVQPSNALSGTAARVRLRLSDRELEAGCDIPFGDPRRPLTFDDVAAKLTAVCKEAAPAARPRALISALEHISELPDITDVTRLLRAEGAEREGA